MTATLGPLEAAFLDWEDAAGANPKQFSWALVFASTDGEAPSLESVRTRVSERLRLLPRLEDRLSTTRVGRLSRPRWVHDSEFDITRHVLRGELPTPGGEHELVTWIEDASTHYIDRRYPMWNLTLLFGLSEKKWAAVFTMHHCLTDGAGAVATSAALLLDATSYNIAGSRIDQLRGSAQTSRRRPLRTTLAGARALWRLRQRSREPARPSLITPLSDDDGHLACLHIPLERIEEIRRGIGGTINDVGMAVIAGGVRSMLEERGEAPLPDYLHVVTPVNMRASSEAHTITMNLSFLNVALPLSDDDLKGRYVETVRATKSMKQNLRVAEDQTLETLAGLVPPVVQRALLRRMSLLGEPDIMITNVPGPRGRITAQDAVLQRVFPMFSPRSGSALRGIVCSYSGILTIAVNAGRRAVPDLDVIRAGAERTLAELGDLADLETRR